MEFQEVYEENRKSLKTKKNNNKFAECLGWTLSKPVLCRVSRTQHSAKSGFAECLGYTLGKPLMATDGGCRTLRICRVSMFGTQQIPSLSSAAEETLGKEVSCRVSCLCRVFSFPYSANALFTECPSQTLGEDGDSGSV